jgi:hypothetical protein
MRFEDTALTRIEGMVMAHHRLYTRASECLRQGDKKQAISLAGAVQILQEMIEGRYSNVLNKIGRDKRLKEYVRVANEIDAATVKQRARQERNLEQLRTKKFSYDFTRIPEYAIESFPSSSLTPRVETTPVAATSIISTATTAANIVEEHREQEHVGIEGNMVTLSYGQPIWEIEQEYLAKNVLDPNDTAMQHSDKTLQQWKTDWEERCDHVDSQQKLDKTIQTVKKSSSIARIDFYREISLSQ